MENSSQTIQLTQNAITTMVNLQKVSTADKNDSNKFTVQVLNIKEIKPSNGKQEDEAKIKYRYFIIKHILN